jgi:hypothetical protein
MRVASRRSLRITGRLATAAVPAPSPGTAGEDDAVTEPTADEDDGGLPPGGQIWHHLEAPRPLHPPERALLDALVVALEHDAATEQARTTLVAATCFCGCPSVRLHVTGPVIPAADLLRWSGGRRDDHVSVQSTARRGRSQDDASVTLQVLAGLLHELEIFAGEGVDVALPAPAALRHVEVT